MGTIVHVFSFLIIFSLSSPPNSHSHSLTVRSLFLLQKTQTHILSSSVLSPSLTSLSLSLVHNLPPVWRDRHCGEINAWHVAWSQWWRCGFELMIDGSDVGRPRWWFNLSLWCGSVLICVGLLGLGWFGLWVDLGMWVWVDWVDGWWLLMVMVAVGLGWSGWWLMVAVGLGWSGWSGYVWRCGGVEAWRRWRFDRRWFFFVWVDRCWLIWCWI